MPLRLMNLLLVLFVLLAPMLEPQVAFGQSTALPRTWQSFIPNTGEFTAAMPPNVVRHSENKGGRDFVSYHANEGPRVYAIFVGGLMGDSQKDVEEFEGGFVRGATAPLKEKNRNVTIRDEQTTGKGWTGKIMHVMVDTTEAAVLVLARGKESNVAYALVATAPAADEDVRSFMTNFSVDNEKAAEAHIAESPSYKLGHTLGYVFGFGLTAALILGVGAFLIISMTRKEKKN